MLFSIRWDLTKILRQSNEIIFRIAAAEISKFVFTSLKLYADARRWCSVFLFECQRDWRLFNPACRTICRMSFFGRSLSFTIGDRHTYIGVNSCMMQLLLLCREISCVFLWRMFYFPQICNNEDKFSRIF